MDISDPRAELALAIASTIHQSLSTLPVADRRAVGSDTARQALVICLAMWMEADPGLKSDDDLSDGAAQAHDDLATQLLFMRRQFDRTGIRMWDLLTETANIWWR